MNFITSYYLQYVNHHYDMCAHAHTPPHKNGCRHSHIPHTEIFKRGPA